METVTPIRHQRTRTAADLPPLARRWLGVLSVLVVAVLTAAILLLVGLSELRADTLRNREVGNGNRVVSCTTVALVDPVTAERLPECRGIDYPNG